MLSIFRRKPAVVIESTFKDRVWRFWQWYAEVAERFYQTIESGNCPSLAKEVSSKVDEHLPGFAWVFGPGLNKQGHSFTLTGEGNLHRQLLAIYWLAQAPELPGWTFHAARQPGSIKGMQMDVGGRIFDPLEFWITPSVNCENKTVDITVWHPLFDRMEERERWTVLFLFLDEVLGEYGTQQWLGEIKHDPRRLKDSIPLQELNDFLKGVRAEQGWKELPPGLNTTLYRLPEQHSRFLRGDIVTGTTVHPVLIKEYLKAEGELEDPVKGLGVDYVFLAFDARILPAGSESTARGKIEDALDAALATSARGRSLGGAWSKTNAYIDLMLFDGRASVDIVREAIRSQNLPPGTSINYFAKEKRGHKIVI